MSKQQKSQLRERAIKLYRELNKKQYVESKRHGAVLHEYIEIMKVVFAK